LQGLPPVRWKGALFFRISRFPHNHSTIHSLLELYTGSYDSDDKNGPHSSAGVIVRRMQRQDRLDQFAAVSRIEDSSRYRQIDADADGSHNAGVAGSSEGGLVRNHWSVGATAGYELDLWGKLNAGRQSACADLLATEQDPRALALSISGQEHIS